MGSRNGYKGIADVLSSSTPSVEEVQDAKPDYLSPEWNDYVMKYFTPDELVDGNPKTIGLRRVAELLLGDIIDTRPLQVFPVEGNRVGRATVLWEVTIDWRSKPGQIRKFADVCDTWEGNTDDFFLPHAVATAATKAEGRALRKALKIKALAAEELSKKDYSKQVADQVEEDRITNEQRNLINLRCKKMDIDVIKYINSGKKKYKKISEVSKSTAIEMIKYLSELSSDKIDESIKGYKEDWNQ